MIIVDIGILYLKNVAFEIKLVQYWIRLILKRILFLVNIE